MAVALAHDAVSICAIAASRDAAPPGISPSTSKFAAPLNQVESLNPERAALFVL